MKQEQKQQSDFLLHFEALFWLAASSTCKIVPLIVVSLFKQSTLQLCAPCISQGQSTLDFCRHWYDLLAHTLNTWERDEVGLSYALCFAT